MRPQHAARARFASTPVVRVARVGRVALVALVVLASAAAAADRTARRDLFDEIFARSQSIDATLKTIDAAFTETTTSPLLAKPLVAEGTLHAMRPSDVELIYTKPERKTITIKGGQLLFVWPDRNLRQERDITEVQARIQKYFVTKSPGELRRHFTIVATEDRERAGTYRLDLTPKRKQIEQGLSRLELWLHEDTLMLDAMRMHFPGDSTKMMEFRDVEVNKSVQAHPPSSTNRYSRK